MSEPLTVVAITGLARSGKDTVAGILASRLGYHRVALADGVRSAFNDLSGPTWELHKTLSDATVNARRALQLLGTEAREATGNSRLWADLLLAKVRYASRHHPAPRSRFVVPDVRFPYEAAWLRDRIEEWGGRFACWRIVRQAAGIAESAHPSETEVARVPYDHLITNDSTIDDLADAVAVLSRRLHAD